MRSDTVQTAQIAMEERESLSIGIAHGDIKHAPEIADATNQWSLRAQEKYGTDDVLMVGGKPIRPLVGAAAVRSAYIKKFGTEPVGIPFGNMPPITKRLDTQQFVYRLLDGTVVQEHDLDDLRKWTVERISNYLEAYKPEVEQPKHLFAHHRGQLLEALKEGLQIIGAPSKSINVPWGGIAYPGNDDIIMLVTEAEGFEHGVNYNVSRFVIIAKKKDQAEVDEFYELVMEEVKKNSIYQGRCFSFDKGVPTFLDPFRAVKAEEVILNPGMRYEMEHEIWNPIRFSEDARALDHRILNKKFVFSGEAGTGKTITALMTAQIALQNGWTVCLMAPGTDADQEECKNFIAGLTPVLGIIEDLESYMPDTEGLTTKQANEERSKLLARIDGGETKGKEVMWILTTNFPDLWISAMARPGRTDGYWEFEPLEREGFERLVRMKLGTRLADDIDFDAIWDMVSDMSSSFLSGLVDKARSYTLGQGDDYKLSGEDLAACVRGLSRQWGWYGRLRDNEMKSRAETVTEFYDRVVRPVVKDELASVGIK